MTHLFLRRLLIGAILVATWLAPVHAAPTTPAPQTIVLGLISTGDVESTTAAWQPLVKALARGTGAPVRLVVSKNYADITQGIKSGDIHVGWVNNLMAIELVESGAADVFVQMVREDGSKGYKSVLLGLKDGPAKSLEEVLARPGAYSLAAGSNKSISGFLTPNYYIFAKRKLDFASHFKSIAQASHRDNFNALVGGKVDLAVNNTEEIPRYQAEQPADWARVRVIWESPQIPNDPIVMRRDLSAATQASIKRAFVGFGHDAEAERVALRKINGLSGFAPSGNHQLRPVVDLAMFQSMTLLMNDSSKSPEQFQAGLADLARRASKLDTRMSATR